MSQAALESGWGKYAPGCNMFGIKWTPGCGYNKQLLSTKEYINGSWEVIKDWFRAYNSLADSLYDHAQFLVKNSRYANLRGIKNYKVACKLIKEDGYATDPNYTNQLIEIIEENKLYQYDNVQAPKLAPVQKKEAKKVKNLVVVGNAVDKRAAEYLADALQCPVIDANLPFDYSVVEDGGVIGVGGTPTTNGKVGWSSYIKKVITGSSRFDTCQKVLDFIKAGCK